MTTQSDHGTTRGPDKGFGVVLVERHAQGPRVTVLGKRVHEYMLGIAMLLVLLAVWLIGLIHDSFIPLACFAVGMWLVAKDWRDMFPSMRDTASWRLGIHRRVAPLRQVRHGESLPSLAALLTLAVAIVNLVSALTAGVPSRVRLLVHVEPLSVLPVFHALALPAAAALALVAFSLARRRRRALHTAVLLLVALGTADLLKGLDVEEAALSFGLAALLGWGRSAFYVASEPLRLRSRISRLPLVAAGVVSLAAAAVWAAVPEGTSGLSIARETAALLFWSTGLIPLRDDFGWLPLGVGLLSLVGLVSLAATLFRPRVAPTEPTTQQSGRTALEIVRAHGRDTLAYFKLRLDARHFFSARGTAFLAYRVENGVLLISGDPVGPQAELPDLLRDVCSFAERSGLTIGAIGVSEELLALYRHAGLQSLYLGDEAIVDTRTFTLEGRSVRKVRQSVHRLRNAGFTAAVHTVGALDEVARSEIDTVSTRWRDGEAERGFSMAMDSLAGQHQEETVVVTARDADGVLRGFLHFVPTFGRQAMSLSQMRRDRNTPNGLTEYLVVSAVELLRERDVEEISLNFAAFARLLSNPRGRRDRVLARLIRLGNPFFQIESLYRFNSKFQPRWEPRYLLYEGGFTLPRVGLAAVHAEGLLPHFDARSILRSSLRRGTRVATLR